MTARVVLGADAWTVLRRDAAGLRLPTAFDGAPLTPAQAAAAEVALRASGVVPGRGGDLVADLHPSVKGPLLLHLTAPAVLQAAVGRGDDITTTRVAVGAGLASSLSRRGGGPVVLETLRADDAAAHVAALLPGLAEHPDGAPPTVLDAVSAVAAEALRDRPQAAAPGPRAPEVALSARLEVHGPRAALVVLAVRTADGWAAGRLDGGDLVLRPLDVDTLTTDLASALAAAVA